MTNSAMGFFESDGELAPPHPIESDCIHDRPADLARKNSLTIFSSRKKTKLPNRPHVIMVSHEASRTGAPKIALNLVKHFAKKTNAQLTTILHQGGALHPDFEEVSETICLDVPREHHPKIHSTVRKLIKPWQKTQRDIICICNSVESRFVANSINTRNIPILYLLHEFPTSYPEGEFGKVYEYSRKLVFPCESVKQAADKAVKIPSGKSVVCPQGLLDDEFGTRIDKRKARTQLRNLLHIPDDAFVVLGCGTVDMRKGVDHFLSVARTYESLNQQGRPVYFCWVGDGPRHPHSAYHYVDIDLANSKQCNIKLVGESNDVEPYFLGADSFLLTSRIDPFPCVIHEAMAARLPIMVFNHSGGAVEAIDDGAGVVIPFANYVETCRWIDRLFDEPLLAHKLGNQAFKRVRHQYRFGEYANEIIQLCERSFNLSLFNSHAVSKNNQELPRSLPDAA